MYDENSNISFEDELDILGINYDDYQYLSDGSYGYFFILVSDLDDEQEKKLDEHPDYFSVTDDVWCRRLESPSKLPSVLKDYLLDLKSKKERERIEKDYLMKIKNQWDNIRAMKERINEIVVDQSGKNIFKPTKMTERVAGDLGTFIAANQDDFSLFCRKLYCYFNEFKSRQCKRLINHEFPKYIEILRHTHSHDDENWDEEKYAKRMKKIMDIYQELIGKRYLDTSTKFNIDFIELQLQLLISCISWLNRTYKNFDI